MRPLGGRRQGSSLPKRWRRRPLAMVGLAGFVIIIALLSLSGQFSSPSTPQAQGGAAATAAAGEGGGRGAFSTASRLTTAYERAVEISKRYGSSGGGGGGGSLLPPPRSSSYSITSPPPTSLGGGGGGGAGGDVKGKGTAATTAVIAVGGGPKDGDAIAMDAYEPPWPIAADAMSRRIDLDYMTAINDHIHTPPHHERQRTRDVDDVFSQQLQLNVAKLQQDAAGEGAACAAQTTRSAPPLPFSLPPSLYAGDAAYAVAKAKAVFSSLRALIHDDSTARGRLAATAGSPDHIREGEKGTEGGEGGGGGGAPAAFPHNQQQQQQQEAKRASHRYVVVEVTDSTSGRSRPRSCDDRAGGAGGEGVLSRGSLAAAPLLPLLSEALSTKESAVRAVTFDRGGPRGRGQALGQQKNGGNEKGEETEGEGSGAQVYPQWRAYTSHTNSSSGGIRIRIRNTGVGPRPHCLTSSPDRGLWTAFPGVESPLGMLAALHRRAALAAKEAPQQRRSWDVIDNLPLPLSISKIRGTETGAVVPLLPAAIAFRAVRPLANAVVVSALGDLLLRGDSATAAAVAQSSSLTQEGFETWLLMMLTTTAREAVFLELPNLFACPSPLPRADDADDADDATDLHVSGQDGNTYHSHLAELLNRWYVRPLLKGRTARAKSADGLYNARFAIGRGPRARPESPHHRLASMGDLLAAIAASYDVFTSPILVVQEAPLPYCTQKRHQQNTRSNAKDKNDNNKKKRRGEAVEERAGAAAGVEGLPMPRVVFQFRPDRLEWRERSQQPLLPLDGLGDDSPFSCDVHPTQ